MYMLIFFVIYTLLMRALFPTIVQGFDFRNPGSSRNNIADPRSDTGEQRTNGKIAENQSMIADTSVAGDFSRIDASIDLEKNSLIPQNLKLSLRRSYRSFLYPTNGAAEGFPAETIFHVESTYYALRNDVLYPFVSEKAFASRYPLSGQFAVPATPGILNRYPVSDSWIGFRIGSLISNASGVFVVVSENDVRPIGSADVFLQSGYDFNDVIPANEEELGIYKRGKIFLLGDAHPDGTIFWDRDSNRYFIVERGTKRPLEDAYGRFLLSSTHAITASSSASEETVECILQQQGFFGKSLGCTTPLDDLRNNPGNDYELLLRNPSTDIDINALNISFVTDKNKQNMLTLLSQIKQRILSRLGYGI